MGLAWVNPFTSGACAWCGTFVNMLINSDAAGKILANVDVPVGFHNLISNISRTSIYVMNFV